MLRSRHQCPVSARVARVLVAWLRAHAPSLGATIAAVEVPLDVVQRVLGHASLQTTTVYVTAEQRRIREEVGRYFRKRQPVAAEVPVSATSAQAEVKPARDRQAGPLARVRFRVRIRPVGRSRGRQHAIEFVEHWCFDGYAVTPLSDEEYELAIPYQIDDQLADVVSNLPAAIGKAAEDHRCVSESEARRVTGDATVEIY
ncbi:hypothetical protein [Burkholderia alba]|uniref:hypothetical protein n=1 Tax=Burkholderia alba TaxID=2683677 RepID=UPI002B05ED00|nr:hypothetical protein [Burkholderia alba]